LKKTTTKQNKIKQNQTENQLKSFNSVAQSHGKVLDDSILLLKKTRQVTKLERVITFESVTNNT